MLGQSIRPQDAAYDQYRKATMTPQQIANDDLRLSLMRIESKLDAIFRKLDSKESEA